MLRALRAEVNALLNEIPTRRRPALRRSDVPGFLLATDLPHASEEAAVALFCRRAEELGWQWERAENGWLLLDKPVPPPVDDCVTDAEGECGCCLSLLARHAGENGDARELVRMLVRSHEAGARDFERFCRQLHIRFAEDLRKRQPLPANLVPYLSHAYLDLKNGRK